MLNLREIIKIYEYFSFKGIPDESAQKVDSVRPIIEVKVNGNQYSIDSNSGFKNACVTFTLNEEFDDVMPNQMVLKVSLIIIIIILITFIDIDVSFFFCFLLNYVF